MVTLLISVESKLGDTRESGHSISDYGTGQIVKTWIIDVGGGVYDMSGELMDCFSTAIQS